jgi:hypothetical protein
MADGAHTALKTMISASLMGFTSQVRTREVRLYRIGANGLIQEAPIIASGLPANGSGAANTPWQVSTAVTLFTGGLGKGRFGRFYLPPQNYLLSDDGGIADATADTRMQNVVTFLNSVRAVDGLSATAVRLCVVGRTEPVGTMRAVTAIRYGTVPDTQRRRRRSLQEAYRISPNFQPAGGV